MQEVDILKEISGKKYEIALISTYSLDINFFESYIFKKLYQKEIKNVSLFVDNKEINKSIKETTSSEIGTYYNVNVITTNNSFHPKMILLLAKDRAKLIIGSGNITTSGWFYNSEFFNLFEYNKENEDYLTIINSAIKSFENMYEYTNNKLDEYIFEKIKKYDYYNKAGVNDNTYFFESYNESIIEQAKKIITDKINRIRILVPYYDNELNIINSLKNDFDNADVELYIQNETSTFPKQYNDENNIISNDKINVFEGFNTIFNSNKTHSTYHGKVFIFEGEMKDYCLYGSANCTSAALYKSFKNNGNFEADILQIGNKNDFSYVYSDFQFKIDDKAGFVVQPKTIEFKNENYSFVDSIYHMDILRCTLSAKNFKESDSFKINEVNGKVIANVKNITVEFKIQDLENVYKISITTSDGTITLTGYYINPIQIETNRNRQRQESKFKNKSDYIFDPSDAEKYMELTRDLILDSTDEIQNSAGSLLKVLSDEIDNEENDNFNEEATAYISYYKPEEEERKNEVKERKYLQELIKIRYYDEVTKGIKSKNISTKSNDSKIDANDALAGDPNAKKIHTKDIDQLNIYRIKRDFDYTLKHLKSQNYLANVNAKYAIQNYFTIVSVFTKRDEFKSPELNNYFNNIMIETKLYLLNAMFGILDITELDSNDSDQLIAQLFELVCLVKDIKQKLTLERTVKKCAKLFDIIDNYNKYIDYVKNLLKLDLDIEISSDIIGSMIENSFGYKSYEKMMESIKSRYDNQVKWEEKGKTLELEITVESLFQDHYKSDYITQLINSLKGNNKEHIEMIIIKYIKKKIIGKFDLEPIEKTYYISVEDKQGEIETKNFNGTITKENKKRLSEIE